MAAPVRTNINDVLADMDGYVSDILDRAAPRALNELRDRAELTGFRAVRDTYDIPLATVKSAAVVKLKPATTGDLEASIDVKGRGFPLMAFRPIQTRAGVSIRIKGVRRTIAHSFLARMPNGHVGVFARGVYGSKFQFRRGVHKKHGGKWTELPINELYTFGPPDAFSNDAVVTAMQDRVDKDVGSVLKREIRSASRGY